MTEPVLRVVTHPGGAHKDDFLACCLALAFSPVEICRREPTPEDLLDPAVCVLDAGGDHDPARRNFDHHQFDKDHPPICALSLLLQAHGLYQDALSFCEWLETTEWLDARGPVGTAGHLGVERDVLAKLNSPIDLTLLRRFSQISSLHPGDPLWEVMRWIGMDMVAYLSSLRDRLRTLSHLVEFWELTAPDGGVFEALFLPRTEPLPPDPSFGIERFVLQHRGEGRVLALIYPDRRGLGYGLSRFRDSSLLNFAPLEMEPDVHFAHKQGFVAKTSATDPDRLKHLLILARGFAAR
jgi:hypothetical protein